MTGDVALRASAAEGERPSLRRQPGAPRSAVQLAAPFRHAGAGGRVSRRRPRRRGRSDPSSPRTVARAAAANRRRGRSLSRIPALQPALASPAVAAPADHQAQHARLHRRGLRTHARPGCVCRQAAPAGPVRGRRPRPPRARAANGAPQVVAGQRRPPRCRARSGATGDERDAGAALDGRARRGSPATRGRGRPRLDGRAADELLRLDRVHAVSARRRALGAIGTRSPVGRRPGLPGASARRPGPQHLGLGAGHARQCRAPVQRQRARAVRRRPEQHRALSSRGDRRSRTPLPGAEHRDRTAAGQPRALQARGADEDRIAPGCRRRLPSAEDHADVSTHRRLRARLRRLRLRGLPREPRPRRHRRRREPRQGRRWSTRGGRPSRGAASASSSPSRSPAGRLRRRPTPPQAVAASDLSLVCVGTPSTPNGSLRPTPLERVSDEIGRGAAPAAQAAPHGRRPLDDAARRPARSIVVPRLEAASGLRAGDGLRRRRQPGVPARGHLDRATSTIRRRPSSAQIDDASGDAVARALRGPAGRRSSACRCASPRWPSTSTTRFHALKVGFANEIGAICKALGVDSHEVMEIFFADTKLNISPAYLRPGSRSAARACRRTCARSLYRARRADVPVPILESILPPTTARSTASFDDDRGHRQAPGRAARPRRSSRAPTTCARARWSSSPSACSGRASTCGSTTRRSRSRGSSARTASTSTSASRTCRGSWRSSADEVVEHAEVCVVGAADPEAIAALERKGNGRIVVDLVRLPDAADYDAAGDYVGVAW